LKLPRTVGGAFSGDRVQFLETLSKKLLSGDYSATLKALGFWLRASHIRQWQLSHTSDKKVLRTPIGRVFIVSPSNVEGLFAYSWALSYLMGNQTVVRVSENLTRDQRDLFKLMAILDEHTGGLREQSFISYDKISDWTQKLSAWCQLRMLWGSDQSIESIRQTMLPAQSQEWVFPDRYSISILHLNSANAHKVPKIAEGFARDVTTFQQRACASPKWVFWYKTDKALQQLFWQSVDCLVEGGFSKNDQLVASQYLCSMGSYEIYRGNIHVLDSPVIQGAYQHLTGVVGQSQVGVIEEIVEMLPNNLQSISIAGVTEQEQALLAMHSNVRQFVQCGEALTFNRLWDGIDLTDILSKAVRL